MPCMPARFIEYVMLWFFIPLLLAANLLAMSFIKLVPAYYTDLFALTLLVGGLVSTYGLRALIWLIVGRRYQLSFVYPLMGLNYILAMLVGVSVFRESFSMQRLIGALIICIGVLIVSQSRHRKDILPQVEKA